MTRALFPGRFQPVHNGHMIVLKDVAERHEWATIVVGSAQESYTALNPLTAGERIEMLQQALREARLVNIDVIPLVDLGRHAYWAAYVASMVPRFDVVVTNNPLTARLFLRAGYRVEPTEAHDRKHLSGTAIRRLLVRGDDVSRWVPGAVAKHIERLELARRLGEVDGVAPGG